MAGMTWVQAIEILQSQKAAPSGWQNLLYSSPSMGWFELGICCWRRLRSVPPGFCGIGRGC